MKGLFGVGEFRKPGEPALLVRSWREALEDHAPEICDGGDFCAERH